jgi:hypothetical protein
MAFVAVAWVALLAAAALRGRYVPAFSVSYNLPISLAFGALALDLAVRSAEMGPKRGLQAHGPVLVVWAAGGVLLLLRLVAKSIEVSGHMSWAILMGVHCVVEGAPRWFTVFAWCIVLQVLWLKLFVLGGQSGTWGVLAGTALGGLLVIMGRSRGA